VRFGARKGRSVDGTDRQTSGRPSLLERLGTGNVLCAEGYLFECERRGYLQAGAFVPEVVLDHPEVILQLHRDFVHAGSDVVEAFTYYAHREKLRVIGREDVLEPLNRQALEIAKQVADETGTLFAGDIANTNIYKDDPETHRQVREMFEEQTRWAADAGVDYVIAETFGSGKEAVLACQVIKEAGLVAVVTFCPEADKGTDEGWTVAETCKRLEDAGADVVGLNCGFGPTTMYPYLPAIVASVSVPVAALPVPYRTSYAEPMFQMLGDPRLGVRAFPVALDPFTCNRYEVADFATLAAALGVRYLGLCCGAGPHHIRAMAEALGRHPPASRYSPDISRHYFYGDEARRYAPVSMP
jgi:betaine-homocysteine S-methyltransferase